MDTPTTTHDTYSTIGLWVTSFFGSAFMLKLQTYFSGFGEYYAFVVFCVLWGFSFTIGSLMGVHGSIFKEKGKERFCFSKFSWGVIRWGALSCTLGVIYLVKSVCPHAAIQSFMTVMEVIVIASELGIFFKVVSISSGAKWAKAFSRGSNDLSDEMTKLVIAKVRKHIAEIEANKPGGKL